MAWQPPKLDWVSNPINPTSADFNRIEGNIDAVKADIETKKGTIVNAINTMGRTVTIANTHDELALAIKDISDDATALVTDVLAPKTFYQGGVKKTGTVASKGVATYTPGTTNQTIAAGQYLSGIQTIAGDADLVAGNIRSGKNIFNVAGTFVGDLKPDFSMEDLANFPVSYVDIPTNSTYTMPANTSWFIVDFLPYVTVQATYPAWSIRNKLNQNILSYSWSRMADLAISDMNIVMSNYGGNYEINNIIMGTGGYARLYYIDITSLGLKSIGLSANASVAIPYDCVLTNGILTNSSGSTTDTLSISVNGLTAFSTSCRSSSFITHVGLALQSGESVNPNIGVNECSFWGRTFDATKYSVLLVNQSGVTDVNYQLPAGYEYIAVSAACYATNTPTMTVSPVAVSYALMPGSGGSRTQVQYKWLPAGLYINATGIYASPGTFRLSALKRAV